VTWCDEILAGKDLASAEGYKSALEVAKKLSVDDLRRAWRAVNLTRYVEQTDGTRFFAYYFDALGKNEPDRACDFILASVADEPDDEQVALIGAHKFLGQLLLNQGAIAQTRLAPAATSSDRLRWLLGSAHWLIKSGLEPKVTEVMLTLADRDAWDAWCEENREIVGDISSLDTAELALLWIDANSRSPIERERDDLHASIFDLCFDLARSDSHRALDLALAVLARTEDTRLLALLAAGLLEDLVLGESDDILTRIEAEAARDPRFRRLLTGVWLTRASAAATARIEKARAGAMPL
jgi:hypothetical protein